MKRSKKCFGLLLALSIMLGLSLSVCLDDTNALQHEYMSIPYFNPLIPDAEYDSSTQKYYLDWDNYTGGGLTPAYLFRLQLKGDSYQSYYDNISLSHSLSYLNTFITNHQAYYYDFNSIISRTDNNDYHISNNIGYNPTFYTNVTDDYYIKTLKPFGVDTISFNNSSLPPGLLTCNPFTNGAVCGGLWNTSEYISSQILPHWYSSSAFYLHSKAIDNDGFHYSHTFSLSDMFVQDIKTFSYLELPLHDYSDYWVTSDNFYSGRDFNFKGVFEFDDGFTWHSDIQNNGSYFRLYYTGLSSSDNQTYEEYVDCNTNLITLEGTTQLEYSCPLQLTRDYLWFYPALIISGNDNYVWTTNGDWRFMTTFVVTDNDNTKGDLFGVTDVNGGGTIIGDARNDIPDRGFDIIIGDVNFTDSLTGLFGFNFLNPFSPLFQMFNDNNSCARIPTIAGMIHLENDEICPWFDSTTRNIVTPVLGIASVMLIFGFAVRWLGASSGNLFEDSANETIVPPAASPRWGRRKK